MIHEFGDSKPHEVHRNFINHLLEDLIIENYIQIEEKLNELNSLMICSLKSVIGSIDVSLTGCENKPDTDMIYKGIRNAFMQKTIDGIEHLDDFFSQNGEFYKQKGIVISQKVINNLFKNK